MSLKICGKNITQREIITLMDQKDEIRATSLMNQMLWFQGTQDVFF